MHKKIISAQDIVKRFHLPYHTVNYYSAIGLLSILEKRGNQRFYDEDETTRRIEEITTLSREGYPLQLIRKKIVGF